MQVTGGLAGLAKLLLGMPLDKRLQCSAWADRPLSAEQVIIPAYLQVFRGLRLGGYDDLVRSWRMQLSMPGCWSRSLKAT